MKYLLTIAFLLCLSFPLNADVYENEWADFNFSLCENVGITSSGRVRVRVHYAPAPRGHQITSFQVFTTHPRGSFPSAKLFYSDTRGNTQSISLVRPWFDTIGGNNVGQLVLPRVRTSQGVGGLSEQADISVADAKRITVQVNLVVDGTNSCVTGFEKDFSLTPKTTPSLIPGLQ